MSSQVAKLRHAVVGAHKQRPVLPDYSAPDRVLPLKPSLMGFLKGDAQELGVVHFS